MHLVLSDNTHVDSCHPKILNSCVVGDKLQDVDETKSVIAEEQKINLKKKKKS